ncbi:MAG TPA: maleylpyruvate isomerase family mycothiol-dependent enzyme [Kineosporiaceae bacterium]|nr:maleylpyruvate isomerase family mycothiol-dependent enzyme [Kineosporiaceae bacterium]
MRYWVPFTPAEALPRLERAMETFAAALATGELGAPVPTCPGWDLRALGDHLGNVHRWARGAIVEGHPQTPEIASPSGQQDLVDWYRESAGLLLDTLRGVDPGQECWTFGPKPRTAAFWFRRQLHETTMHGQDAGLAAGGPAAALDLPVALDGVHEVAGLFFPRQVRLHRIEPLARALAVVPSDPDPAAEGLRWVLAGDGTGPACAADAPADVEVTGPADVLLDLLWHRAAPDDPRLSVTGDRGALDAVLGVALTS